MNAFLRSLPRKLKAIGPRKFIRSSLNGAARGVLLKLRGAYSQYGEDLAIDALLGRKKEGFYVDIGAFDPHRLSNTKMFYLRGWRGINVEPHPEQYGKFLEDRPEDINLNVGVAGEAGHLEFFEFEERTRSGFSREEAEKHQRQGFTLVGARKLPVTTLRAIFDQHCAGRQIDFLSVDTEGLEVSVLQGNDWERFRPTLVCVESYEDDFSKVVGETEENPAIREFLSARGYDRVYDNGTNCIYRDSRA
jgi:FkbM family methyltransferase